MSFEVSTLSSEDGNNDSSSSEQTLSEYLGEDSGEVSSPEEIDQRRKEK